MESASVADEPVAPVAEQEAPVESTVAEADEPDPATGESDDYAVTADPVVQDLVDLGGEVTDVQYISTEED